MIKFTIVKDRLVLDNSIVLFDALKTLYKEKDGFKWLQVIYYMHSADDDNPFKDLDKFVLEENVLSTVFKKTSFKEMKMSASLTAKYKAAEDLFIKYNSTPEKRLLASIDKKLDEITNMLDDNKPVIEESENDRTGEIKFSTNLNIILNAFSKIETILKSKTLLKNSILKADGEGRVKGGGTTSFRERGLK